MEHVFTLFIRFPWLAAVVGVALLLVWRHRRRKAVLVAGVLWIAYACYEFAVPYLSDCGRECDMRVDLLLIYPVLLVASLIALAQAIAARGPQHGGG